MRPTYEFITGRAGTGKSFLLQRIAEEEPGCVLTSTTGISAVNTGGITLHSLLWFYSTQSLIDAWTTGKLEYRLADLYKNGVRRICTDEISMMDKDAFSTISSALEELNIHLNHEGKPPLCWTLAADFSQLPPVEGDFAFESEHWPKFGENTTYLDRIYRQSDSDFIDALQSAREGNGKRAAEYFRDIMYNLVDPNFDGTTMYPYNSGVDRLNGYRLERAVGKTVHFTSRKEGKPRDEWKYIPDTLTLKIGALVMLLANKSHEGELLYSNGDLGSLESVDNNKAYVKLKRNNQTVEVQPVTRLNEELVEGNKRLLGSITYSPIRLAWSSTIHKSQGLTVDAAQIDFRAKFFRECFGMLYVALSRCRTKAGLRLVGSPKTFVQNCVVNPKLSMLYGS